MSKAKSRAVKEAKKQIKKNKTLRTILIVVLVIAIITLVLIACLRPQWLEPLLRMFGVRPDPNNPDNSGITPIDAGLQMTVLDIGQGDCIYLQLPDGQNMLIDIGSEFGTASPWDPFAAFMQNQNVTQIDHVMFTHTDYDHIREGKKLVDNYEIKNFYIPYTETEKGGTVTKTWDNLYAAIHAETYTAEDGSKQQANVKNSFGTFTISGTDWTMRCHSYEQEDYPRVYDGASAEVKNAVSPICVLEYAGRTIVLTGDSNERNEEYLLKKGVLEGVDADVLKVAHHGSKTSTVQGFLDVIDAEYALISAGAGNDYGHPTNELLNRLTNYRDVKTDGDYDGFDCVYRTDLDGDIVVQVSPEGAMNVISEKIEANNRTQKTLPNVAAPTAAQVTWWVEPQSSKWGQAA